MDEKSATIFAEMFAEIGIAVTAESLLPDTPPSSPVYCPSSPSTSSSYGQLPSFEHMTHMQPCRVRIPYKRSTHFAAHLAQLTGRVKLDALPKGIVRRLRRSGVKPTEQGAYFRIRRLLKKWGYSSPQYRCIFAILKQMGGPTPRLSYAQERALRQDFDSLTKSWNRLKSQLGMERKNFPSYYLITQLLLKKYKIPIYYSLPSIKDNRKFNLIVDAYQCITHSMLQE